MNAPHPTPLHPTDRTDFDKELRGFQPVARALIVVAGDESAALARHVALRHPQALVVGIEASAAGVLQARNAARGVPNLCYQQSDMQLNITQRSADHIICRHVLQRLPAEGRRSMLATLAFVLKRGGTLHTIDADGSFDSLYPSTRAATPPKNVQHHGAGLWALLRETGFVPLERHAA